MFDTLFGGRKVSKCKKLISRVQCRLKFLKSKSNSIARHMRNAAAAFILSGHSEHALDRIEQLYNDLALVSGYELLDEFCELISLNLSCILGNKDVPDDIKEAVSSLIFASARCGDIPELGCIRKLFRELYGQRFIMAAVELLPGNLVNDQIKEKLSRKPVPQDSMQKLFDEIARDCSTKPDVSVSSQLQKQDEEHRWNWKPVQVKDVPTSYSEIECYQIQQYESLSISNASLTGSSQSDATSISVSSSIVDGSSHDESESPIYQQYLDEEEENSSINSVNWEERASTSSSSALTLLYLESRRKEEGNEDQRLIVFKPSFWDRDESFEEWKWKRLGMSISRESQSQFSSGNWKPETRHEHGAAVYHVFTHPESEQFDAAVYDVFTYPESEQFGASNGSSSPYPRPSFVHPKLPDYFDIAAKFMAL